MKKKTKQKTHKKKFAECVYSLYILILCNTIHYLGALQGF